MARRLAVTRGAAAVAAIAAVSVGVPARAAEPSARPIEVGASLGYGVPVGATEAGARVSDGAFGIVPFGLDVAYRLAPRALVGLAGSYAIAIPTLCATAGDCTSSLGRDVALTLRGRYVFGALGPVTPRVDVGAGYESLTTRLSDKGIASSKSYQGAIFGAELEGRFRAGDRWSVGPLLGAFGGVFRHASLDAPGVSRSGAVDGARVHAWLTLGIRVGFAP